MWFLAFATSLQCSEVWKSVEMRIVQSAAKYCIYIYIYYYFLFIESRDYRSVYMLLIRNLTANLDSSIMSQGDVTYV